MDSILFSGPVAELPASEPAFFADLNLDQFATALTDGRDDYQLRPLLYQPARTAQDVYYRQAVFRDLEQRELRTGIESFAESMRDVRANLADARQMHYQLQRSRLFLTAARTYCHAVDALGQELATAQVNAAALRGFREQLAELTSSHAHAGLRQAAERATGMLADITYTLHLRGSRIRVSALEHEADLSEQIRQTFRKFEQQESIPGERRQRFPKLLEVDHVEAGILDRLAQVFPAAFDALAQFFEGWHGGFIDRAITRFDREIQFYLSYLDYIGPLRAAGLPFCYPSVVTSACTTSAADTFDLVLAAQFAAKHKQVVTNDVPLTEREHLMVVTGPNQGGKTTYARSFGQLHYLTALGCPVPGSAAHVVLADQIFTHFEQPEDIATLSGKLKHDLQRIRAILHQATDSSVVILNEIFTSTTTADALVLSERVLGQLATLDCLCVCVTFLDELASFTKTTASMVASIQPDDPASRTYRLMRRPADGLAYADAVAAKFGLTYQQVKAKVAKP